MEDMPYPDWIRFTEACFERYGQPVDVVDLGCGTGTLTLPLARRGYAMTGIDLSNDMLSIARQKEQDQVGTSNIQWLEQDMRELELNRTADAIVSFCDCLNYITEEEGIIQTFHQVANHLRAGGLFFFDVHHPKQLKRYNDSQPFTLNEEDIAYIWTCEYTEDLAQIEHELTIFAADPDHPAVFRRIDETHVQRAYSVEWLKLHLQEAGFTQVDVFGDFAFESVNEETERVFFAAIK
jgi:SAM-dependent methyltransferase